MPWKESKVKYQTTDGEGNVAEHEIATIETDDKGNPIFVQDSGRETCIDAQHYFNKIPQLIEEKRKVKEKYDATLVELSELKDRFMDLDPEVARKALETVENLDAKKLIDSKKVEELKSQMREQFNDLIKKKETEHQGVVERLQAELGTNDIGIANAVGHIKKLTISNAFRGSKILNGPEKKVTIPVEMAEKYWADYFRPEEIGGKLQPVGYIGDRMLYSPEKPGEPATFDEAIMQIIETSPFKEAILKGTGQSGGGGETVQPTVENANVQTVASKRDLGQITHISEFTNQAEKIAYIDKFGKEKYNEIISNSRRSPEDILDPYKKKAQLKTQLRQAISEL